MNERETRRGYERGVDVATVQEGEKGGLEK